MRIAGIDGSTKKTGFAIFDDGQYVKHILFDHHKFADSTVRIEKMIKDIWMALSDENPDVVRMEESMMTTNVDTVKKLSNIAGAVWAWCVMNKKEFIFLLPSEWRKKIGLRQGRSIKRDVLKAEAITAVKQEYNIAVTDDEAEAILIARSGFDLPKIIITEDDIWGI